MPSELFIWLSLLKTFSYLTMTYRIKSRIIIVVLHAQSYPTLCYPWTVDHQAPLSMEFSRQGYWSGLTFPTPVDLPNTEIEFASSVSPALSKFFTTVPPGSPQNYHYTIRSPLLPNCSYAFSIIPLHTLKLLWTLFTTLSAGIDLCMYLLLPGSMVLTIYTNKSLICKHHTTVPFSRRLFFAFCAQQTYLASNLNVLSHS